MSSISSNSNVNIASLIQTLETALTQQTSAASTTSQTQTGTQDTYSSGGSSTNSDTSGSSLNPGISGATGVDAILSAVLLAVLGNSPDADNAIQALNNSTTGGSAGNTGSTGQTGTTGTSGSTGTSANYGGAGVGTGTSGVSTGTLGTSGSSTSTTGSSSTGTLSTGNVTGSTETKDGYTVADCKADMAKLAASQGGTTPPEPTYTQIAQGIIDGVNNNFSGQNLIGNFSSVSGADMAKTLISSAWQESKFGEGGESVGGVFQCAQCRLDQYNENHGTSITEAQLQNNATLSTQVGTWAMANPIGIVGVQASGSNPIPSSLQEKALYYWNYNPDPDQNGSSNQLSTYVSNTEKFQQEMGSSAD